jgi:hypothetical protein
LVREKLEVLGVKNIRLIRKIVSGIDLVHPTAKEARESISKNVVLIAVLLSWLEYASAEDRPTLEFLKDWNVMVWYARRSDKKASKTNPDSEDELRRARWSEILDKFGLRMFDSCDAAVGRAIRSGFVEGSGLAEEIEKLNRQADASEATERFVAGWRRFHDSFENDEEDIATTFDQTFDAAAPTMSPGNVNATVVLLRNFGKDTLADNLIERYIRIRSGERELFDPDNVASSMAVSDVQDEKFKERFAAQHDVVHKNPSLLDAATTVSRNRGFSGEEIAVLTAASEDDYYDLFTSKLGDRLGSIVKGCLQFAGNSQYGQIASNATAALKRIAAESRINRLRVERHYGITPD